MAKASQSHGEWWEKTVRKLAHCAMAFFLWCLLQYRIIYFFCGHISSLSLRAGWSAGWGRRFCPSALVRSHLQCCVQLWGPQQEKEGIHVGTYPEKATKMLRGLEHLYYGDRTGELELLSLEKIKFQGDFGVPFSPLLLKLQSFRRGYKGIWGRTSYKGILWWGNSLKEGRFIQDVRREFFTWRLARHWMLGEVVDALALEVLMAKTILWLGCWFMDCLRFFPPILIPLLCPPSHPPSPNLCERESLNILQWELMLLSCSLELCKVVMRATLNVK